MFNPVKKHYQDYPYPVYPLIASVHRSDTYALNLTALWARFNGVLPPPEAERILIAGCGTFAPYPWAVANPDVSISALDLSENSLKRARWHCRLHLQNRVDYRCADLMDTDAVYGDYGLIDSFGVLHHLDNPLDGLKTLARHLLPGGILRIMLYSRYARREEESIRRAFRLLGVDSPEKARALMKKAVPGARLAHYLAVADEPVTDPGLADALLHPRVHTYRLDELLELIDQSALEILLFAHHEACEKPSDEIERLRSLEKERQSPGNFVIYLGKKGESRDRSTFCESKIMLNPCLLSAVSPFKLGTACIYPRIGIDNPPLCYRDRRFLRRFVEPVSVSLLSSDEVKLVAVYKRLLFLVEFQT